jgi:hypothetical protein
MAVVRANYCQKGKTERKIAKANISYIQTRPGRDKQRQSRTLFGPTGAMGRGEANQCITDAPHGTYFYRLKLSPDPKTEDIKRDLPMQKLTQAMMKRLEKRLKADIPWVAALHDDHTDVRHVHILAAIPKRLQQYELEFLIREATALALSQRRFRDRGEPRLPWQEHTPSRPLKSGKYTAHRDQRNHQSAQLGGGGGVSLPRVLPQSTCACPRCHMPQRHNEHRGSHLCQSCGLMLHQQKALALTRQRQKGKGRGFERSL